MDVKEMLALKARKKLAVRFEMMINLENRWWTRRQLDRHTQSPRSIALSPNET